MKGPHVTPWEWNLKPLDVWMDQVKGVERRRNAVARIGAVWIIRRRRAIAFVRLDAAQPKGA